jgi:hypothetical protein
MGLADKLVVRATRCRAAELFDELEPDDRAAVDEYVAAIHTARLTNRFTSIASVSKLRFALAAEGHQVSTDTLRDHVGGRCCCGKTS